VGATLWQLSGAHEQLNKEYEFEKVKNRKTKKKKKKKK